MNYSEKELFRNLPEVQRYLEGRQIRTEDEVEIEDTKEYADLPEVKTYVENKERRAREAGLGLAREAAASLTFQFSDEAEAFFSPGNYYDNFDRITKERNKFKTLYPGTALTTELIGATASGVGTSLGLARAGIKNLGVQGFLEGEAYGLGAGTTPEERLVGGAITGAIGGALGSGIQALTRPRKLADGPNLPEVIKTEDIVNYTKPDGETVMAKVVGEEGDYLLVTTDFLSSTPKIDRVERNSPSITKRDDYDFEDLSMTPIERVPKGEEAPYTPLSARPTQSGIDIVEEPVAGPPRPPSGGGVTYLNTRRHSNDERVLIEDLAAKLFTKDSDNIFIVTETELQRLDQLGLQGIAEIEKKFNLTPAQRNDIAELVFTRNESPLPGGRYTGARAGRSGQVIYLNDVANSAARAREKGISGASPAVRLTRAKVLAHEFGHAAAERELGREVSKHIDGWQAGVPKQGGFARGLDESVAVPKAKTDTGQKIIDEWLASGHTLTLRNYNDLNKFEEWLVDSIARYAFAAAPKAPKGTAKKFFWQTGKGIRTLYRKMSGAPALQRTQRAGSDKSAIRGLIEEFVERHKAPVQPTRLRTVGKPPSEPITKAPKYREAARPQWTESIYGPPKGPSWRDAKTAGEFWDGIKLSFRKKYDALTPMTDLLQRNVSRQAGARAQIADENATRINQLDFENFVEPIQPVAKAYDDNPMLRQNTLLLSEGNLTRAEYIKFIEQEFGKDLAVAMNRYLNWSKGKNARNNEKFGRKAMDAEYLHRQPIFKTQKEANEAIEQEFGLPIDPSMFSRTVSVRDSLAKGKTDILDYYQNPFFTNTRRLMNNEKLFQYMDKFGVQIDKQMLNGRSLTPDQMMTLIGQAMRKRGISQDRVDYALTEIKRNLLGERKMMNQTLQALQTLGYAGTLAGTKSALLNLHDIPQTAVNQGPRAVRAWFQGVQRDRQGKLISDSFGFSQQSKFGEFANSLNQSLQTRGGLAKSLNNTANVTTNALMKASLFQLFDKVGKGGVLRIVQQRAVDDVAKGGWQELKKNWGSYFSDAELRKIARDLNRHGMDDSKYSPEGLKLTEELMMAGLGQQQLISAGGRPAFWANHPNARVFLALRGFAMKQQAVALRNVFQNAKEGNVQEAKDWATRYALYSMGAFAAINEGRQILFGDGDFSPNRVVRSFFDQLVGVMSLNSASVSDYSWGKIQRGELLSYVIDNNIPIAFGVPKEAVEDALDVMTGEKELSEFPETLPLVKQVKNLDRNIQEGMLTGQ